VKEVDALAITIDGTIEIAPLAIDLDVGYVHPPIPAGPGACCLCGKRPPV
jgi:hypothetical protein